MFNSTYDHPTNNKVNINIKVYRCKENMRYNPQAQECQVGFER